MSEANLEKRFKKAIVTGGAGFIGSHIIEELLQRGIKVVCVDDYTTGKKENVAPFRSNPDFAEAKCDVTDCESLERCFEGVDIVFHNSASKKTVCLRDPRRDLDVNAKGMFNILTLAKKHGVKKIVHASTGSVYGEAIYYPQDEKHPLAPTSFYGVSKLAAENYAQIFAREHGLDITILRYFHVYGPRQDYSDIGGVVSIFTRQALNDEPFIIYGDGSQQRSFTFVKDIVRINMFVAANEKASSEIYNCASGIRVTISQLAQMVKEMTGRLDLEIIYKDWNPGDIKTFIVDNSKLRSLGFEFGTDFETGLKETIAWMKTQN